jgi:hypothetical protein
VGAVAAAVVDAVDEEVLGVDAVLDVLGVLELTAVVDMTFTS